jgi:hypothetical protein
VHNACRMRFGHAFAGLNDVICSALYRQHKAVTESVAQVASREIVQYQIRQPDMLADIAHTSHMRAAQTPCGTGFVTKSGLNVGAQCGFWPQELERDIVIELRVQCTIHASHPALPEQAFNLVFPVYKIANFDGKRREFGAWFRRAQLR